MLQPRVARHNGPEHQTAASRYSCSLAWNVLAPRGSQNQRQMLKSLVLFNQETCSYEIWEAVVDK